MLLVDNRGMDDDSEIDFRTVQAVRLLIRAQSLRWQSAGLCGSDRAALLNAAVVLERMAVSGADGGQGRTAIGTEAVAAEATGHAETSPARLKAS